MTRTERLLIRTYRRTMPQWILRQVSSDTKDSLLRAALFGVARPRPALLWQCLRARVSDLWSTPEVSAERWHAIASKWPAPLPDLIDRTSRHAALKQTQSPTDRAQTLQNILADLDGPHELKCDKVLVKAIAQYVQTTLPPISGTDASLGDRPLQRIVLCLDRLKMHGTYTHARAVFAICRNLLTQQPDLQIHLVIDHEHLSVGQANAETQNAASLSDAAQAAMGELFDDRFFLHVLNNRGLDGLVLACRTIVDLDPDLVLYGGGHRGPVSNEARVIRHCLFPRLPTAFFFFQANDEVDANLDLIISRGAHRLAGTVSDHTAVRVQPYPTLGPGVPDETAQGRFLPPSDMVRQNEDSREQGDKPKGPVIVSAIVGDRMEARLDELGPSALRRFLALLDEMPGTVWHFIGSNNPTRLVSGNRLLRNRVERGQVVVHPVLPVDDFERLVTQATVFIHLPGFTGGSGGAGVARRAQIPVLTFRHSDVASRQPSVSVFDERDISPCISLAREVLTKPNAAKELVATQNAYTAWLRAHAASGFLECLREGMQIGRERVSQSLSRIER